MGSSYTVESGDHLSAIATRHGFRSFVPLWNAPENSRLRSEREDPHQLLPGDQVYIPDLRSQKPFIRETGRTHTFVVQVERLNLRIRLLGLDGRPRAGAKALLTTGGTSTEVVADPGGTVTVPIPMGCTSGTLQVATETYELAIGGLGPVTEAQPLAARLQNLGYWYGDEDDLDDPDALALGVELLQRDNRMNITGVVEADILDKIDEVHDGR